MRSVGISKLAKKVLPWVVLSGVLATVLWFTSIREWWWLSVHLDESQKLRAIGHAYSNYLTDHPSDPITAHPGDTAHTAAAILAASYGPNEAALWYQKKDNKQTGQVLPKFVLTETKSLDPDFARLTLEFEIAANITLPEKSDIFSRVVTPIVWTRGLHTDGTWDETSPWKGKGGFIYYFDGHGEWVDGKLSTDANGTCLFKYGTSTPTANIREALPPGAVILSAEPNGAQK